MARSEYGTGSLYQRASDGRWVATIEAGSTRNGTRRRITRTGKTKTEAKEKRKAVLRELETSGDVGTTRPTVKTWAEQWLDIHVHEVRPSAYNADRSAITNWIIPTIGHRRLEQLTPADIRAIDQAQMKAGRSSSTSRRTHAVLMKMLKDGLAEGHTVPMRVLTSKAPPKGLSDRESLTMPDAVAVLEVAATLPDASRWVAALLQGMRQGECLGLTWPMYDRQTQIINVSWQLQTLPYVDRADRTKGFRVPRNYECRHLEGAWHLTRPKTRKGERRIPVVPWMQNALDAWHDLAPHSPHQLVWPRHDGRPVAVPTDVEEWQALQCTAEVGHPAGRWYHLHEARNTTATLLMELGVDGFIIQAILGHASIETSHGYMQAREEPMRAALERAAQELHLTRR